MQFSRENAVNAKDARLAPIDNRFALILTLWGLTTMPINALRIIAPGSKFTGSHASYHLQPFEIEFVRLIIMSVRTFVAIGALMA
jgi:hypothetical protein